jgi:hypothetical protein
MIEAIGEKLDAEEAREALLGEAKKAPRAHEADWCGHSGNRGIFLS